MTFQHSVWHRNLAAAIVIALGWSSAQANHKEAFDELLNMDLETLMGIRVVTASKTEELATTAPAQVTVVTAADIRAFGYRTLGDILRSMPGLQVSYDHSYAYLGVRGINRKDYNSRILVLIDGVRTNENMYDSSFIDRTFPVDVEAIDRVEFVAGPGSSLYGNNALLGVVNVMTRRGAKADGVRLVGDAGERSTWRGFAEAGRQLDNGADLYLTASRYLSDGANLHFPGQAGLNRNEGWARDLDGEVARKVFGRFSLGGFSFMGTVSQRDKDVPTAPYGTVFGDPAAHLRDRLALLSASYETEVTPDLRGAVRVGYGAYDFRNDYHYDSATPDPLNHDIVDGRWWNGEITVTYTGLSGHRIVAGMEVQNNTRQNYRNHDVMPAYDWLAQTGHGSRQAFFVDDAISLNSEWRLDLGLRIDRYHTATNLSACDPSLAPGPQCLGLAVSDRGMSRNPRAALIYTPRPDTVLKLLYARAFRAPSPTEVGYVEPPTIATVGRAEPELLYTRELVVEHYLDRHFKVWANLFKYDFQGVIDIPGDTFVNLNDIRSRGAVLGVEHHSHSGGRLRASYTYASAIARDTGERLDDAPRQMANLAYTHPLPGMPWRIGAETLFVGERRTLADDRARAYTLVNLTLSSERLWNNVDISASIYNLLDQHYEDPARGAHSPIDRIPQDGRTFRLQVGVRF
ncbi:MAG: TonB-dependent receptor [Zoogloeaceae bacterium]|nr:TonB-dependent receptor [Zoogloeaceae bacterium]